MGCGHINTCTKMANDFRPNAHHLLCPRALCLPGFFMLEKKESFGMRLLFAGIAGSGTMLFAVLHEKINRSTMPFSYCAHIAVYTHTRARAHASIQCRGRPRHGDFVYVTHVVQPCEMWMQAILFIHVSIAHMCFPFSLSFWGTFTSLNSNNNK